MQWLLQDVDIGHNLQRFRKNKGFSQADVVAQLQLLGSNMSRKTYSMIETGVRNIRISDLIALKVVFDVDFAEFFEDLLPKEPLR